MDQSLLNKSVPRYTSYPTAVQFTDKIQPKDYQQALSKMPAEKPISLYVHIPFCPQLCWYCGCHTQITKRQDLINRYVDALCSEVKLVANYMPSKLQVNHVHFGGGTPNALSVQQMTVLMKTIRRYFDVTKDAEIAIELDPRTLNLDMIACLKTEGFNRVSLGVQDFDPEVQQAINRIQPYDQVAMIVKRIREVGIEDISFDLIYGLPKQNTEKMARTLDQVAHLSPKRVSVFGYAHVPWMKSHQKMIKKSPLPSSQTRLDLSFQISNALNIQGYENIGIDHFAKPDDEMAVAYRDKRLHRNFQGYTTDNAKNLIGLGASSIGKIGNIYIQNTTDISLYQKSLKQGDLGIARGVKLSVEDARRADIIQEIMCYFCADIPEDILMNSMDQLSFYIKEGIISLDKSGRLNINDEKYAPLYARLIAACFDQYLPSSEGRHAKAV